jgi:hypothetical protein
MNERERQPEAIQKASDIGIRRISILVSGTRRHTAVILG